MFLKSEKNVKYVFSNTGSIYIGQSYHKYKTGPVQMGHPADTAVQCFTSTKW